MQAWGSPESAHMYIGPSNYDLAGPIAYGFCLHVIYLSNSLKGVTAWGIEAMMLLTA
jgi:hypothetical protein